MGYIPSYAAALAQEAESKHDAKHDSKQAAAANGVRKRFADVVLNWRRQAVLTRVRSGTQQEIFLAWSEFLPVSAASATPSKRTRPVRKTLAAIPPSQALSQSHSQLPASPSPGGGDFEGTASLHATVGPPSSLPPLNSAEAEAGTEIDEMLNDEIPRIQEFEIRREEYLAALRSGQSAVPPTHNNRCKTRSTPHTHIECVCDT